jgi:tetratricopeptide (TPR) repeat protein
MRWNGSFLRAIPVLGLCFATTATLGDQPNSSQMQPADLGVLCAARAGHAGVPPQTLAEWAGGARLFDGLGGHRRTGPSVAEAQPWFDQGMRFLWAFNHDEATRAFARAAQIDPDCAMCFWGVALTVGPNYNLPMMAEPRAKVAWEALQQAQRKADHAAPVDRALIEALGARYQGPVALDPTTQGPVLTAYAKAMLGVADRFPDDNDVQVLTAEALMNVNAWKLWSLDGKPADGTDEIIARLNRVLARDPQHPGANHYLVHAVEASPNPEHGLDAANRLRGMMPAAGHMEHMPAHIYQRIGRYAEAAEANRKGAASDIAYYKEASPPDYYAMYTAHNYQFLAYSTAMQGRKADTILATRHARAVSPDDMLLAMPGLDWAVTETYTAMIRFGLWDDILAEPAPNPKLLGLVGGHLYATTVALAAKGQADSAKQKLAELERHLGAVGPDDGAGLNTVRDVLAVAALSAKARIADAEGRTADAVALLREAVASEDRLAYNEPADWFVPSRHALGAALLKANQPVEAESVYREDLKRYPENGWALFGLQQALTAQGRTQDAQAAKAQFDRAWQHADVTLTASAF